ncbi:MAG: hypothetical protein WC679_12995 [Bacteroidales bacterium]|jgi:hypothetical protein
MSILIDQNILNEQTYENEDELQKYLFQNPNLLRNENDAKYYSVKREVFLPSGGRLDIFLIDEHGTPIAVEVKLDRNSQSKREVVAQVFDYISDISSLNYHSLDDLVDGKLEDTVNRIDSEGKLPKIINGFINSGFVKVIIAIDHVNNDLKRIMTFLNERTNLDVRLIEINKYSNGQILIPKIVVDRTEDFSESKIIKNVERNEIFEEVITYYNSNTIPELRARNETPAYRLFRFNNWPSGIHYEFIDRKRKKSIGVEFHIEKAGSEPLKTEIEKFNGRKILDKNITFDPTWSGNKGRLKIDCLYDIGEVEICNYMFELIKITKDTIDVYYPKNT